MFKLSTLELDELEKVLTNSKKWRPQRDLNPRYRRERAVSWTGLDDGDPEKCSKLRADSVVDKSVGVKDKLPLVAVLQENRPFEWRADA